MTTGEGGEPGRPRWFTVGGGENRSDYLDHFRKLAAEGADLAGEARFVDTVVGRGSRILDAGCGAGRVAGELHRRGHDVLGVDADPMLIEAATADVPGPSWLVADLATLDLPGDRFDAAVLAGNVMVFLAPGSEGTVLQSIARHIRPGGVIILGFATDRHYSVDAFDRDCRDAGLLVEQRFATWDLRPWCPEDAFAVTIVRVAD